MELARIERLVYGGTVAAWDDVFEITVVPAVTAEEGLRVAKPMCDVPATALFTEALKEGRTIVFADQSGFYLLPAVVRTYAPVGQTPILHEHLRAATTSQL